MITKTASAGIDLFWLPLGAGGHFVRFNGHVYELLRARRDHRPPLDLYHTALEVMVPEGRFVIENSWPIPNEDGAARGVTVEGPVWNRHLGRFRVFRYEVRRWLDGTIPDVAEAVASPQRVSDAQEQARTLLALAASVPAYVWGRDQLRVGEMWNSNSVISRLLTSAGLPMNKIYPPAGGRAPGWATGVVVAERTMQTLQAEQLGSLGTAGDGWSETASSRGDATRLLPARGGRAPFLTQRLVHVFRFSSRRWLPPPRGCRGLPKG
jgi:hypothetical protein